MEILLNHFLIKALIASVFAGFACGIVGVWVYIFNIPFVGVTMAHTAFAGAVVGLFIGVDPILLATILCIVASIVIGPIAEKGNFSPNISTGILFSFMLGIAFLFMGMPGMYTSDALSFMWGSILTVSLNEIILLAIICAIIILFMMIFKKGIIAVIYNRAIALASGMPEKFIFYSLLILCALTVSLNIKTIGGFLIYSLITIPPASAAQFTKKLKILYILSVLFAILSCIIGLTLSYLFDWPAGASIIVATTVIFFISFIINK